MQATKINDLMFGETCKNKQMKKTTPVLIHSIDSTDENRQQDRHFIVYCTGS